MKKYWVTPEITLYSNIHKLTDANHLLICGSTGSGKSVVISHLLRDLLSKAPCQNQIFLLDPKRVDFNCFRNVPHISYANDYAGMNDLLNKALDIMESRYRQMENKGIRKFDGSDLYIIIDEYADLHDVLGKDVENKVIRLCQLARAAKIHVILGTQRATGCVSTRIRTNMDYKLCLHTASKRESINVIEQSGAELLPLNGYGIFSSPAGMQTLELPDITDDEISEVINHWTSAKCYKWKSLESAGADRA